MRFLDRFVVIDGDTTGKEYLFSTSSWYSFTELHDLDSGNFSSWFTPEFFGMNGKYIFSFNYDILRQPNTNNFFIIYCQYEKQSGNDAYSESYYIRKFKLDSFSGNNAYNELKVIYEENNENIRSISSFIMEAKSLLVVLYIKTGAELILRTYNYELTHQADVVVGKSEGYERGGGPFFKALGLSSEHAAIIYYPKFNDNNNIQIVLSIYKYNNGFSSIFSKEMRYTSRSAEVKLNEFYKVNDNRLIFVTKSDKFYFYLFDLFESYSKIIVNIFEYSYTDYAISKDITLYYFNDYIYFTGTIEVSNGGTYSIYNNFWIC